LYVAGDIKMKKITHTLTRRPSFIYNYIKAMSPLFRSHPLDEERITTIINMTNNLEQQRKQRYRDTEDEFRKSQSEWKDFLKEKEVR
jgi:predicted Zn-dependent protease